MQIIGYELDTAMNIEYFRPKLMTKSLILWSKFDRQSWAGQLWRSMSMEPTYLEANVCLQCWRNDSCFVARLG